MISLTYGQTVIGVLALLAVGYFLRIWGDSDGYFEDGNYPVHQGDPPADPPPTEYLK